MNGVIIGNLILMGCWVRRLLSNGQTRLTYVSVHGES